MEGPLNLDYYLQILSGHLSPVEPNRSVSRERNALHTYWNSLPILWRNCAEDLARLLPPMADAVRVVLLVPSKHEETRICGFLNALRAEYDSVHGIEEAIILDNWSAHELPDETRSRIANWSSKDPFPLAIHYVSHIWPTTERCPLAKARKLLADVAIWRSLRRKRSPGPLYFLSSDADIQTIQRSRTHKMVSYLDRNPHVDAVCGINERNRKALGQNHLLLLDRRSWDVSELLLSAEHLRPENWRDANFHWNRVTTPGSNLCVSAEAYALAGGYSDVRFAEDMDLGQRISVVRGRWQHDRFVPNTHTICRLPLREESSAIRMIYALAHNTHPYEQDGASFFSTSSEQAVRADHNNRSLRLIQQFSRINRNNQDRFAHQLNRNYEEVADILLDIGLARQLFTRTMYILGFSRTDFCFSETDITVSSFARFSHRALAFSRLMQEASAYSKYR